MVILFYLISLVEPNFLAEEGILEDCTQLATDKVSEWQESNKNKVLQSPD
jgi:hypothetical protein